MSALAGSGRVRRRQRLDAHQGGGVLHPEPVMAGVGHGDPGTAAKSGCQGAEDGQGSARLTDDETYCFGTFDGELSLVPADAYPLLTEGRLDRRLFNLSELVAQGYDASSDRLPLLLTVPSTVRNAPAIPAAATFAVPFPALEAARSPCRSPTPRPSGTASVGPGSSTAARSPRSGSAAAPTDPRPPSMPGRAEPDRATPRSGGRCFVAWPGARRGRGGGRRAGLGGSAPEGASAENVQQSEQRQ